jgi:hypothetical protein
MTNIFQIDWIFVDTIIIVLLLLLLFTVKIFKITYRWRNSFSNQSIEHRCFSQAPKSLKNHFLLIKKWCLSSNSSLKAIFNNFPYIIVFRNNYKRKFLKILTEGLCSYGFNVINVKLKIKHLPEGIALEKKTMSNEWKSLISAIFGELELTESKSEPSYIILTYSNFIQFYKPILLDPNNLGALMINPKLNKRNISAYYDVFKNNAINTRLYSIFSRKSLLILKNRHMKRYFKNISPQKRNKHLQCLTIEKARCSFKYYETIVLGMIIDIIENRLLKST